MYQGKYNNFTKVQLLCERLHLWTQHFFFLQLRVHLLTSHLTWNLIWTVAQRISCHRTQQNVCGAALILVSSAQACAVGVLPCRTALRRMARESLHSKTARVPEWETVWGLLEAANSAYSNFVADSADWKRVLVSDRIGNYILGFHVRFGAVWWCQ